MLLRSYYLHFHYDKISDGANFSLLSISCRKIEMNHIAWFSIEREIEPLSCGVERSASDRASRPSVRQKVIDDHPHSWNVRENDPCDS